MTHTPRVLEPHCEWMSDQVADESLWTEVLTDTELAEIDAALRGALAKSEDVLEVGREDFPLPTLHQRLVGIESEPLCRTARRTSPRTSAHTGANGAAPAACG